MASQNFTKRKAKLDAITAWKLVTRADAQWAEDVKVESFDLKFDHQLEEMRLKTIEKLPKVQKDLDKFNDYPDAIKFELNEQVSEEGFDLEGKTKQEWVDEEFSEQKLMYEWKVEKLAQSIIRLENEQRLRKDGFLTVLKKQGKDDKRFNPKLPENEAINRAGGRLRAPLGTTFYVDADCATPGNGSSPVCSGGNAPFDDTLDFTEVNRNAGDIAIHRRGTTALYDDGTDLLFNSDGNIDNPIVIEADYDDVDWTGSGGDFANSSQTYTPVFGSKAMLASTTISDITAGEWVFNTTDSDDAREFSYEVAIVQASDSGTDDGADSNKLIDTGKFTNTVIGTQVVNTTDSITGFVSQLVSNNEVEVTDDGRPSGAGATIVVFDNGDTFTIADQLVLFLPWKGSTGATKTLKIMPAAPIWGTASTAIQWNFDNDHFWKTQGLHLRGQDSNGIVEIDGSAGHIFKDIIFEGSGGSSNGLRCTDDNAFSRVYKTRFFNYNKGMSSGGGAGTHWAEIKDSLFDGNDVSSDGVELSGWEVFKIEETEFRRHTNDLDATASSLVNRSAIVLGRNLLLSSGTQVDAHEVANFDEYIFEDFDGTLNDTRQLTGFSTAEGTSTFQSETGTTRSGGSNISIKVTPSTKLSTNWEFSRIKLFEIPFYATTDSKQYEVFFRPTATTDWTDDPTNVELWIELEYWGHASNNFRRITKSTGVIDMNGSTTFTALSVTIAPSQAGVAYLRCYYAKTKESGKDNTFFVDPIPVVT